MLLQSKISKLAMAATTGAVAAAVAAGPAFAAAPAADGPFWGKVIAKTGLNIRSAPNTSSTIVGTLPFGAVVGIACKVPGEIVDGNPRWYRLNDGSYAEGFSAARYIENVGPAPDWCPSASEGPFWGKVIAKIGLNVRSAPNTSSAIVDRLPFGAVVGIKCKVNGETVDGNPRWYKLNDNSYVDGWSAARYIENIGAAPTFCP